MLIMYRMYLPFVGNLWSRTYCCNEALLLSLIVLSKPTTPAIKRSVKCFLSVFMLYAFTPSTCMN